MNMNEDISTQIGSKEKVVHNAHQVAFLVGDSQRPNMGNLCVDQLMQAAFFNGRTPRSAEYKAGTRMALEHRIDRTDIVPPYEAGTAAADAFFAGLDEGKSIWRAAVAKICGAA